MVETKTVDVGDRTVQVTVDGDDVSAELDDVEAILVSSTGAEVHLRDLAAADIRKATALRNEFLAFFNDEDRAANSPDTGNPISREGYDRNWYFNELKTPDE